MAALPDTAFEQFLFVHAIGGTFTTIAIFEHTLINALWAARGIKIDAVDRVATSPANKIMEKRDYLQSKTLGNIINVLVENNADGVDIDYLKFLQKKRDFFIHRFFSTYPWPGDVGQYDVDIMCRKLKYLEIIFGRAAERIWNIIGHNGYAEIVDLGLAGKLLVNNFDADHPFAG